MAEPSRDGSGPRPADVTSPSIGSLIDVNNRGPTIGCRQVGDHLGVAHVDADDVIAVGLEPSARRGADT